MLIWSKLSFLGSSLYFSLHDLLYAIMHGETICCIPLKLRIADNRIVKLKIDLFEFISQF